MRAGPADYVARSLPVLSELVEVTCLTASPGTVDPELRRRYRVRSLDERWDPSFDLVAYHVANNPFHEEVLSAALAGPPGLLALHDGSLHHLMSDVLLRSGRHDEYAALLADAHGDDGERLARVRIDGSRGDVELFVYDLLGPLIDCHLGVVVHSRYAAGLVEARAPGAKVWLVPHFAHRLVGAKGAGGGPLGLPTSEFLLGHFGFITPPKRPVQVLEAFAQLRQAGIDAHLVFCGADHTAGGLAAAAASLRLRPHVTVTGYASEAMMAGLLERVDAVVSVRAPHVGETSGTLVSALAAGKAVIADSVGTWAELPDGIVERVGGDTEAEFVTDLARAMRKLATHPAERARLGTAASAWAEEELDVGRCIERVAAAAKELVGGPVHPPGWAVRANAAAVAEFLAGGVPRVAAALLDDGDPLATLIAGEHLVRYHTTLSALPPARARQRLLDIGSFPPVLRLLETVWGYAVVGVNKPVSHGAGHGQGAGASAVELPPAAGLPAYTAEIVTADVERERLPFGAGTFEVICAWEILEHLGDPMNLLWEANRVLAAGGLLVLTTPNVVSRRAVRAVLEGGHPYHWAQFQASGVADRHQREYAPEEVRQLLAWAGFSADGVRTADVWAQSSPLSPVTESALGGMGYPTKDRGDCIVAIARKVGLPAVRYPQELYFV